MVGCITIVVGRTAVVVEHIVAIFASNATKLATTWVDTVTTSNLTDAVAHSIAPHSRDSLLLPSRIAKT